MRAWFFNKTDSWFGGAAGHGVDGGGCAAAGRSSSGHFLRIIISADSYGVSQTLDTRPTARTLALDSVNHVLYTVAANRDTSLPGARPTLKPGTFTLITISK